MNPELGIVLRIHGRRGSPKRMRRFQTMRRVTRPKLARLHHKCRKERDNPNQKHWIAKQEAETSGHQGWRIVCHAWERFKRQRRAHKRGPSKVAAPSKLS